MTNLIKAQSPAGFAEEYIVESIWNGKFAPGSILPAERELSELIGVTRTTLREVLQRLARDGWRVVGVDREAAMWILVEGKDTQSWECPIRVDARGRIAGPCNDHP